MKSLFTFVMSLTLISCNSRTDQVDGVNVWTDEEEYPVKLEILTYGEAFLQPLDTLISLSLAGVKGAYMINFQDSDYCSIVLHSVSGKHKADRKYKIVEDVISFIDPRTKSKKNYNVTLKQGQYYMTSVNGEKWRMVFNSTEEYFENITTSNDLKRQAFLYPVLDDEERMFGAGPRYKVVDGRMVSVEHPDNLKVREVKHLELF